MDDNFIREAQAKRPKIEEHFDLKEEHQIGRGSYGVVYKVQRKSAIKSNKYYALKLVDLSPYSSSTCREISVSSQSV